MSQPSQVIILLEDSRQQQLIRKYLTGRGVNSHAMRFCPAPVGQGSAEGWVRNNFPAQVRAYRQRQAKVKTALIVVIDADTHTVQDRLAQLDQALKDNSDKPVDAQKEQVVRLVPRRNIETWILCLNGQAVDEDTDYKTQQDWSTLIANGTKTLLAWTQPGSTLPQSCIPSLRTGVKELQHLGF